MSQENELSKGRGSSSSKVSISYRTSMDFERRVSHAAAANKCLPQPSKCMTSVTLGRSLQNITKTYIVSAAEDDSIVTLFGVTCVEPA